MGRIVKELALETLGEKGLNIWSKLEIIGDIAVLRKPLRGDITLDDFKLLAEALLARIPSVKSVWLAITPIMGPYKIREYIYLAGEHRSWTIYREHGCSFKVDIAKVFVTPRLNYEHLRVSKLVKRGEIIVNMFAGIGIFSIIIAKHSRPETVHSIDVNPEAYNLMVDNIRLNRVEDIVVPCLGDAAKIIEEKLVGVADRILMPLPDLALEYIPQALLALKRSRGALHVYLHMRVDREKKFLADAIRSVEDRVSREDWKLVDAKARVVRKVGPGMVQVVVDAEVERSKPMA